MQELFKIPYSAIKKIAKQLKSSFKIVYLFPSFMKQQQWQKYLL